MTRTSIIKTAPNEVTLHVPGEAPRIFWVPSCGGYVHEGVGHAEDRQACAGLGIRGGTLRAEDGDDLLALVRKEWAKARRLSVQQEWR